MATPTPSEPTVQRTLVEYTIGTPGVVPPTTGNISAGTTNINVSEPPLLVRPVGVVSVISPSTPIGALVAGQGVEVSALVGVPELSNVAVSPGRELRVVASAGAYHSINGLILSSIQIIGVASSASGGQVVGLAFPGGNVYTSVSLRVILRLWAVHNTTAGSISVWVSAALYDALASQ